MENSDEQAMLNDNSRKEVIVEDGEVAGYSNLRRSNRENLGQIPNRFEDFEMPSAKAQSNTVKSKVMENQEVHRLLEVSGVSSQKSVYSRRSVMSKASETRQREKIELERMQSLYNLEQAEREARKALIEQERLVKLAELEEMQEQNSQASDDFESAISKNPVRNVQERTAEWISSVENQNVEPQSYSTTENKIADALMMLAKIQSDQAKGGEMKMFMQRQVALTPLREFSGKSEEWLGFIQDYRSSTEMCNLKNEENLKRLCRCLRGKAKDLFLEKLKSAESVPKVIEQMEELFGQPRLIIQSLIRKVREMPFMREDKPDLIVNFAHAVDNLVDSMKTMKCTGHMENPQLMDDIVGKMPTPFKSKWADLVIESDYSLNLEDLAKFLCRRAKAANVLRNLESDERKINKKSEDGCEDIPTAAGLINTSNYKENRFNCIFCEKSHPSYKRWSGMKMSTDEKKQCIMMKKVCFVCLKSGHTARDCKTNITCTSCGKRHYTIMCFKIPEEVKKTVVKDSTSAADSTIAKDSTVKKDSQLSNHSCTSEVILQTLLVNLLKSENNKEKITVRALIDTGSHRSFLSNEFVKRMQYKSEEEIKIIHGLFGGVDSQEVSHQRYQIRVGARDRDYICTFAALNQELICGKIPKVPKGPWLQELSEMGISISDVGNGMDNIDLLLGADVVGKLLTGRKRVLRSGPVAVETFLGWTLMGKVPMEKTYNDNNLLVTSLSRRDENIQELWSLDSLGIKDPIENKSKLELQDAAMKHFLQTVKRNDEGRYVVSLPWIDGHEQLASNRQLSEKRLENATQKLVQQNVYNEYEKVFEEWKDEDIIEEVPLTEWNNYGHYLPHRAVIKLSSETTKVRPVFDASAHQRGSPSLNQCLETGPNLLELIPDVLAGFRLHRFGVISDIRKAFLQICIKKEEQDYLRFLWWEKQENMENGSSRLEKKLKMFRHKRVVFGVNCSPFLLGATIHFHLNNSPAEYKNIAEQLKKSFYVDNCVTSLKNEKELNTFMQVSKDLMNDGKFDLRGWKWTGIETDDSNIVPVLGLIWNTKNDTLSLDVRDLPKDEGVITKRKILSAAHKVFDPIGFTAPATLLPKLLIQKSWELKTDWDEELPVEISKQFKDWIKELPLLEHLTIPRWIFSSECDKTTWSLHVFSDACEDAYAACVYLRGTTENGISVQLIQAKTRVAPVRKPGEKKISISRLELMGCCIAARLAATVKSSLQYLDIPNYYWTDSSNAYYWIRNEEPWNVFVQNRVKEIRSLSDTNNWRHIPGKDNPADLPSRGCSISKLIESSWWEGPEYLRKTEDFWPKSKIEIDEDVVFAEKKKKINVNLNVTEIEKLSTRILQMKNKKYQTFLNIVSWMLRFVDNCKQSMNERRVGKLNLQEIEKAEIITAKLIQTESNGMDFIKNIKVFKDNSDVLRVKTKIVLRDDSEMFRCPIVLPAIHPVVKLMIEDVHLQNSHAGVQMLMCILREKFWIIRARKTIRSVIRTCLRCRRFEARKLETETAPLPLDRVRDAAVFEITGVDYAGPLHLTGGRKSWICIFTCAVYRAVHLELVSSLSTENFLMAFRRFIDRRGRPTTIFSDNGTTFVGANNSLRELDWEKIESFSTVRRIKWNFNVPSAPWMGGFWERLVQMVKKILRRVLGKASLKYEELYTVLCDAECIINNRPLTYMSEDMEDLATLTPAMFLNEIKENGVADLDALDSLDGKGLNRRMMHRNKIREDLKNRFRRKITDGWNKDWRYCSSGK